MTKARLNAVVDIISGIIFLCVLGTGTICSLALPLGGGNQGGLGLSTGALTFLSIAREGWIDLPILTTLILVGSIVLSLTLHWAFIRTIGQYLLSNRKEQGEEQGGITTFRSSPMINL